MPSAKGSAKHLSSLLLMSTQIASKLQTKITHLCTCLNLWLYSSMHYVTPIQLDIQLMTQYVHKQQDTQQSHLSMRN